MILFISGRTDIVAFYSNWLMNRMKEGFVDVRNPFHPHFVSRIYFEDVDLYFFCTKNPIPILPYLNTFSKPIVFHVTVTPYKKEIEPHVPDKRQIIKSIKTLSNVLGRDKVVVRYDPVFLSDTYTVEYHKRAFAKLCEALNGVVDRIIISFLDEYKNVRKNKEILKYREITEKDYEEIGLSFSSSARENHIRVSTCYEKHDLCAYGFVKEECLSREAAKEITGKKHKKWNARKCSCAELVDIGHYNTCIHHCKYCYANYDEKSIEKQRAFHDPTSSLLIGHLEEVDEIHRRK